MNYEQFIASKQLVVPPCGFEPLASATPMFAFQKDVTSWAVRRGRAAIFADTGLGKTRMILEWARQVVQHTGRNVLVLAPLAVTLQTVAEGARIGIVANYRRSQEAVTPGITVANYEMLDKFDASQFVGIVLDESGILKSLDGKTRTALIELFAETPYRLACTATPAPNDHTELGNHAEFLGVMSRSEMLATFFCHDGGETQTWRLKGHAEDLFWKWVCTWGVAVRKPSDLGYDDKGLNLQNCDRQAHVGVDHSWEKFYQAVRRSWRFGQLRPVVVHVVASSMESAVVASLRRKEADMARMSAAMIAAMRETQIANVRGQSGRESIAYAPAIPILIPDWLISEAA